MAAKAKTLEVINTEKEFDKVLGIIGMSADFLAHHIHIAGLYALKHVNTNGDVGRANRLIDAMGKKHDKKRVQQWLIHFGKLTIKKGVMVFRKRKDIGPENADAWQFRANEMPYWELNKQAEVKITFDYLNMIKSVIATHDKKAVELQAAGKSVNELNVGLLDGLKQLVAGYTPVVVTK